MHVSCLTNAWSLGDAFACSEFKDSRISSFIFHLLSIEYDPYVRLSVKYPRATMNYPMWLANVGDYDVPVGCAVCGALSGVDKDASIVVNCLFRVFPTGREVPRIRPSR